jgi:hypothetical protein
MHAKHRAGRAFPLTFLFVACAPAPPPASPLPPPAASASGVPRRVRVHVDHVARKRTEDFESARRELLAAFSAKKVSEGTTFVLETDEPAYLSLRPFESYADLDSAGLRQRLLDEAVGEATLKRLDDRTHATLVPPHKNEMWSFQSALSYAPAGGPRLDSAGLGRMVEDEVMPANDDAYDKAIEAEVHALTDAHFPASRIVYVSAYGSGRYVTLWLASRPTELESPLPADAQAQEAIAKGLAEQQIVRAIRVRPDLGSR